MKGNDYQKDACLDGQTRQETFVPLILVHYKPEQNVGCLNFPATYTFADVASRVIRHYRLLLAILMEVLQHGKNIDIPLIGTQERNDCAKGVQVTLRLVAIRAQIKNNHIQLPPFS